MDMNSIADEILFENNINNNQNAGNNNSNSEHNENININPSILNNNNNEENKMDIIIELQKKLLEVVATSNENQSKILEVVATSNSLMQKEQENQSKLLEAMATSNSLMKKEQENQTELLKEIKAIKINQGTNNSAIEFLLNKLYDIEKQKNQNQENHDDKGKIQDKEQKK